MPIGRASCSLSSWWVRGRYMLLHAVTRIGRASCSLSSWWATASAPASACPSGPPSSNSSASRLTKSRRGGAATLEVRDSTPGPTMNPIMTVAVTDVTDDCVAPGAVDRRSGSALVARAYHQSTVEPVSCPDGHCPHGASGDEHSLAPPFQQAPSWVGRWATAWGVGSWRARCTRRSAPPS